LNEFKKSTVSYKKRSEIVCKNGSNISLERQNIQICYDYINDNGPSYKEVSAEFAMTINLVTLS
jgi:hypothetical protein